MPSPFTAAGSLPSMQAISTADLGKNQPGLEEDVVALYDQFRAPLLRYLASLAITPSDGEEVIQEVFLALFQHLRSGKPRENLRAWLFRVSHNLALKRRARVRRDSTIFSGAAEASLAVDPAPNPEQHLIDSRFLQRVAAVVQALPEQDRTCLYLRAEGLSYREVAEVLNMSLGAVSSALARCLARIARATER